MRVLVQRDLSIEHNNLAEYEDTYLYDLENPEEETGNAFYLAMAQKFGQPVLDIGCGTGRFTIPLAREGVDITGLDIMPGMLSRAQEKSGDLPITWIEADARGFHLDRQFRLIFESGALFQHLLTRPDQEAMLACVRQHLADDGRFIVSAFFPKGSHLTSSPEEAEWFHYETPDGRSIHVSGTDDYDAVNQIHYETAVRRWQDAQSNTIARVSPLALRRYFPQELENLLHYNGFTVVERYGDWDFSPLTNESPFLLFICRQHRNV